MASFRINRPKALGSGLLCVATTVTLRHACLLVVLASVPVTAQPAVTSSDEIATKMEKAWESMKGWRRVYSSSTTNGPSMRCEEWMRRPDAYRRIYLNAANGAVQRDELVRPDVTTMYYPEANLVVRERTSAVVRDILARGSPREEKCSIEGLRSPSVHILREEEMKGRACWVVALGAATQWWVCKEDYMWIKKVNTGRDGKVSLLMETLFFEEAADLPDSVFDQRIPSGVRTSLGPLPFGKTGLPVVNTGSLEEMTREVQSKLNPQSPIIFIPSYLPRGFGYVSPFYLPSTRAQITFFNPDTGGTLQIVERPFTTEQSDTPDAEGWTSVNGLAATMKRFSKPFEILRLEFALEEAPIVITATQLGEEEVLKVASSLKHLARTATQGSGTGSR